MIGGGVLLMALKRCPHPLAAAAAAL